MQQSWINIYHKKLKLRELEKNAEQEQQQQGNTKMQKREQLELALFHSP